MDRDAVARIMADALRAESEDQSRMAAAPLDRFPIYGDYDLRRVAARMVDRLEALLPEDGPYPL